VAFGHLFTLVSGHLCLALAIWRRTDRRTDKGTKDNQFSKGLMHWLTRPRFRRRATRFCGRFLTSQPNHRIRTTDHRNGDTINPVPRTTIYLDLTLHVGLFRVYREVLPPAAYCSGVCCSYYVPQGRGRVQSIWPAVPLAPSRCRNALCGRPAV
jgi:hypothetical protein